MTTNYQKGANFERRVRKELEENGYLVVRSAGSKGLVDLVAIKRGFATLVQCKATVKVSAKVKKELHTLASEYGCIAFVAHKDKAGHIKLTLA